MTPTAKYISAGAVARSAALDLDRKPERWQSGPPFDRVDMRPGRVVMIGAPPGAGKTTLALQLVSNILAAHSNLSAMVANVEMAPEALVEKLLARLARVNIDAIQNRELLVDERRRIETAKFEHAALLDRIGFLDNPFTLAHLADVMLESSSRLAVIDYAQRFGGTGNDDRAKLDDLMTGVRALATAGAGVVLISSVSRQKSANGSSTYSGLGMASFRGSSELEFGCDSAYILDASSEGIATLVGVKNRYGAVRNTPLRFDGGLQTFSPGCDLDAFDAADLPTHRSKK